MALRPGLQLRQSQRLALTPALRQSIKILQLSAGALADLIAEECAENPFLDYKEPHFHGAVLDPQIMLDTLADQESLPQYLIRQLGMMQAPKALLDIARYLAWNLTDDGFLADDPWTVSEDLDVPQEDVRQAARLLQACEPAGIGAYGLKHSLELQVTALGVSEVRKTAILGNLQQFTQESDTELARRLSVSETEVAQMRDLLRSLTPRPAEQFSTMTIETRVPEVSINVLPGSEVIAEPIDKAVPIPDLDQKLYQTSRKSGGESSQTLENQFRRAQDLIRAIGSRQRTILRISDRLCTDQAGFFLNGPENLRPLTQVAMAHELEIHPSTLSRAIAHKSLACAHGIFPFSFFFTPSLRRTSQEGEGVSAFVVQQEILRLVRAEKPGDSLSDARITTLLRESGVDIARRTVAKYRQCLNIPSSTERRKSKSHL